MGDPPPETPEERQARREADIEARLDTLKADATWLELAAEVQARRARKQHEDRTDA